MSALQRFNEQLAAHNLAHLSWPLLQQALPAIKVVAQPPSANDLPVGTSKLGGAPDFPPETPWPLYKERPLALLAQFCLSEIAGTGLKTALPTTGMIYFFYDMVDQPWGYDPANRDAWKVIYCDAEMSALTRTDPPLTVPVEPELPIRAVEFQAELTLPPNASNEYDALKLTSDEADNYLEAVDEGVLHRLLGYPALLQNEIDLEAQMASNGVNVGSGHLNTNDPNISSLLPGVTDWQLLFQMDDDFENTGWFGGAGGRLYYSIRKQDLEQGNFDNVWVSFHWT